MGKAFLNITYNPAAIEAGRYLEEKLGQKHLYLPLSYGFYEIEKTGVMTFKASSENDITLITCLQKTNKQIIYHGTLIFTSNIS